MLAVREEVDDEDEDEDFGMEELDGIVGSHPSRVSSTVGCFFWLLELGITLAQGSVRPLLLPPFDD